MNYNDAVSLASFIRNWKADEKKEGDCRAKIFLKGNMFRKLVKIFIAISSFVLKLIKDPWKIDQVATLANTKAIGCTFVASVILDEIAERCTPVN